MNLLDKLRTFFARGKPGPGTPAKRTDDSAYSATFGNGSGGGFAGGAVNRLTVSLATWSGAINADLDASLVIMRARARQLAQSNEYGRRFLSLVATNVVGPHGPKLQVRAYTDFPDQRNKKPVLDKVANDAIEVHYARWCKVSDVTGRMDFAQQCRVAIKGAARDGEALVRYVRRPDLPYGIALQLLEADRLDEQLNVLFQNGGAIRQGVEIDSSGRPLALHIKTTHPGDRYTQAHAKSERVPMSQILHIYLPERAEQVRGYSWFHAIILRALQLHGFNEAAVIAARIGASKVAALVPKDTDGGPMPGALDAVADGKSSSGALHMDVEAGDILQVPQGYDLDSWNPEYPHANFESFVKAAMRGISAGLDVATHNLSGDMTDVNYSSARIAELSERDMWITLQQWFIRAMVQPVFEEWLAIALLRGEITLPNGKALPAEKLGKFRDAARFQGRRWPWVDPSKEIDAAQKAVDLGITSRTRLAAERGEEFDDVLDELTQEREQLEAAKLAGRPVAPPAAPPAPPPQE